VNQARRGDDLVGRIAPEVEAADHPADVQRDRPRVHPRHHPHEFRVVQIDGDPLEVRWTE
jgi:hypothetical protein